MRIDFKAGAQYVREERVKQRQAELAEMETFPPSPHRHAIDDVDGLREALDAQQVGQPGPAGEDGRSILSGAGAPAAEVGVDGDFYIDAAAWAIYGPKSAGQWGAPTSIIGPSGPSGAAGADGVQGPTGPAGAQGPSGPQGEQGPAGPQGEQGPAGQDGAPGTTVVTGVINAASGTIVATAGRTLVIWGKAAWGNNTSAQTARLNYNGSIVDDIPLKQAATADRTGVALLARVTAVASAAVSITVTGGTLYAPRIAWAEVG